MRKTLLAVALSVLPGCAGYSIQQNGSGPGYDAYQPEPYLMRQPLTADSSKTITGYHFEIVWLPNYSKAYRVHSWAGLGKADFEFTFDDGWRLSKVSNKADNTNVLAQLVDLTKHLVPQGSIALGSPVPSPRNEFLPGGTPDLVRSSETPVLYKIEFDGCGKPVGLRQVCEYPCGGAAEGRFLSGESPAVPAASPKPGAGAGGPPGPTGSE